MKTKDQIQWQLAKVRRLLKQYRVADGEEGMIDTLYGAQQALAWMIEDKAVRRLAEKIGAQEAKDSGRRRA